MSCEFCEDGRNLFGGAEDTGWYIAALADIVEGVSDGDL